MPFRAREKIMSGIDRTVQDRGAVFDANVRAEFVQKDVVLTMSTMGTATLRDPCADPRGRHRSGQAT